MLLIDPNRTVLSLHPAAAATPFLYDHLGQNLPTIRTFLDRLPRTPWLIHALQQELTRHTGPLSLHLRFPEDLLEAVARAIAAGILQVATSIPGAIVLAFDPAQPTVQDRHAAVVFPSDQVTAAFLRRVLRDTGSTAAFQQAFAAANQTGPNGVPPWDANDPARVLIPLLRSQRLALVHAKPTSRFHLCWMEYHGVAVTVAPAPAPPPPKPQSALPPPPANHAPKSTLPNPPATLSPQALTLKDAAKNGTPFCEECARAAAAANA